MTESFANAIYDLLHPVKGQNIHHNAIYIQFVCSKFYL